MPAFKKLSSICSFLLIEIIFIVSVFALDGKKIDIAFRTREILLVASLLSLTAVFIWHKKRERDFFETGFLIGFLIWSAISFYVSDIKNYGLSEILLWGGGIILYLAISRQKIAWRDWFLKSVIFLAVINVIFGYWFYFTRPEQRMVGLFFGTEHIARLWPNAFALFMLMTWPLIIAVWHKKYSFYSSLLLSFILSGFILSYSRAAMMAFIGQLGLFLLYAFFRQRPSYKKILGQIILIFTVTIILISAANLIRQKQFSVFSFAKKASFSTEEKSSSISERELLMKGGLKLSVQKPWFGYGPYSFASLYRPVQTEFLAYSDHPHNWFIKIAAENGWPAVIFLIGFLIIVLMRICQRFKHLDSAEKTTVLAMTIAVAGGLAHNLVDYNFNFLDNFLLFWLLLAFIRSSLFKNEAHDSGYLGKLTLSGLAIIILAVSLREGYYSVIISRAAKNAYLAKNYAEGDLFSEKYSASLFSRDYFFQIGWQAISRQQFDVAEKFLKNQISKNPYHAESYKLLGELRAQEKDYPLALDYYEKALKLDPMNHFVYYYRVFQMIDKLGPTDEIKTRQDLVLDLLAKYEDQVRYNVHFTAVQHENVDWAIKLYDFLGEINPDKKTEFNKKADTIKELAERHREKFEEILEYWQKRGVMINL